ASALSGAAVQAVLQGAAMSGLSGLANKSADLAGPGVRDGARLAAKGGMAVAAATGRLTGAGAGKTVSAWQKRTTAIESMKRLNRQRHR
ncbi:TPA: conjugal transfer protein TrbL, partial [Klebsiella pneumoniae]|nr:conjugal transfer protein TrbL [Klebsiella pneumoniae]